MSKYKDKSDFEINKRVAELINRKKDGLTFAPCSSWSDIGPIIEEYKIDIEVINAPGLRGWYATCSEDTTISSDVMSNPKRAAAIVFIEMMEARQ